tara:strand:- start:879 stop:1400 length:522 start_codon:yes stop_codon:yes gene_type:complete
MMAINMILAADEYGGIGYKNDLPWAKIKLDLKWFAGWTTDNVVVMGSNTWKSLGKIAPLKDRLNYVITSKHMKDFPGAHDLYDHNQYSLESIITAIQSRHGTKDIYIIGGKKLYDDGYKFCDKIFLTRIEGAFSVDTTVDIMEYLKEFKKTKATKYVNPYPEPHCTFEIWDRK